LNVSEERVAVFGATASVYFLLDRCYGLQFRNLSSISYMKMTASTQKMRTVCRDRRRPSNALSDNPPSTVPEDIPYAKTRTTIRIEWC